MSRGEAASLRQTQLYAKLLALLLAPLLIIMSFNHYVVNAGPLPSDLSLSLNGDSARTTHNPQADKSSRLLEQIMNDDYQHDFELSIKTLDQLGARLVDFVHNEQISVHEGRQPNLMSVWVAGKGGSSLGPIVLELDYVLDTFWSKFKPLIEKIILQRPANLGPNDLDFRCRRAEELKELKEMGARSSIYSIYLDTFFSELHLHCLLRKLALIRNSRVVPSALLKQFVDIYLDLPTSENPTLATVSKELQDQAAHQILAGKAINFDLNTARARHGTLSMAADLVFDPRTGLSLASDARNTGKLVHEFQVECERHNGALSAIWGDFDSLSSYLSSPTSNLVDLTEKIKLAAPQLVYGSICGQLLMLRA